MDTTSSIRPENYSECSGRMSLMATSAASRPRAINALPTRGVLFLVEHVPLPAEIGLEPAAKSPGG